LGRKNILKPNKSAALTIGQFVTANIFSYADWVQMGTPITSETLHDLFFFKNYLFYLFILFINTLSLSSDTPEEGISSDYRWL